MSGERSRKSHALAWALSVLAVPVLYLLSVPPLEMDSYRRGPTPWMHWYGKPYTWLEEHTPLQKPLDVYRIWHWDRFLESRAQKDAIP